MGNGRSAVDDFRGRIETVTQRVLDAGETVLRERPTMEHVLLLVFLVAGVYMFWGAREFSAAAAEFPRVMAGGTALLAFLILARNYLTVVAPLLAGAVGLYLSYGAATTYLETGEIQYRVAVGVALLVAAIVARDRVAESTKSFVAEPKQILGDDGMDDAREEGAQVDEETESSAMYTYDIDDPLGPAVTGALCVLYMILTFTIGMLYATPIFVALWALWVRMEPLKAAGLVVIAFVTAYLFYDVISSDIAEGWLTGWEPTPPDDLLGLSTLPAAVGEWLVVFV